MIRPYFAGSLEGSTQIHIEFAIKLGIGNVFGRGDSARTGIVYKDVNTAELGQNLIDSSIHPVGIGNIARYTDGLHTEFLRNFGGDSVHHLLTAGKGYNFCPLIGEGLGHLHTKAGGTSGHKGDLSR